MEKKDMSGVHSRDHSSPENKAILVRERRRRELVKLKELYPKEAKRILKNAIEIHKLPVKDHDWWLWDQLWAVHIKRTESPHKLGIGEEWKEK